MLRKGIKTLSFNYFNCFIYVCQFYNHFLLICHFTTNSPLNPLREEKKKKEN